MLDLPWESKHTTTTTENDRGKCGGERVTSFAKPLRKSLVRLLSYFIIKAFMIDGNAAVDTPQGTRSGGAVSNYFDCYDSLN